MEVREVMEVMEVMDGSAARGRATLTTTDRLASHGTAGEDLR
jgi:hypothetical protein